MSKSNWIVAYEAATPLDVSDLVLECKSCRTTNGWVSLVRLAKPKRRSGQVAGMLTDLLKQGRLQKAWIETDNAGDSSFTLFEDRVDDDRVKKHIKERNAPVPMLEIANSEPGGENTSVRTLRDRLQNKECELKVLVAEKRMLQEQVEEESAAKRAMHEVNRELRADLRRKDEMIESLLRRGEPIVVVTSSASEPPPIEYPYGMPNRAPIKRSSLPATYPCGKPSTIELHVACHDFRPNFDIDDVYDGLVPINRPNLRRRWATHSLGGGAGGMGTSSMRKAALTG